MNQILNKVRDVDPNKSEDVKDALNLFFQNLPKYVELNCNIWLRALENVVTRFPKYCMSHRTTIEQFLICLLDSKNYYSVVEAAKCAHALQQVRPTQEKTATPKTSWRSQMQLLCNAAHSLLTALFPNAMDMYRNENTENDIPEVNTPLAQILKNITTITKSREIVDKQSFLETRLRNVLVFIQAMLVETYPVAKPVRPQLVLDVVVRSVSATTKNDHVDLAAVKIQALATLDALIACLGSNLIPFSPLVFKLVMQTLRWTTEKSNESSRKVRCAAYATIKSWLTTLHVHRATNTRASWEDELANCIVDDITPPRKLVELTMGPLPTKHLSKKARKKMANSMLRESSISIYMPGEKNKVTVSEKHNNEVAMAALDCAETFLVVCGIFLKPATHKLFQENLVRECYRWDDYLDEHLLALLRAMEAARKCTPNTVPPPTQHCLHLYSTLVNTRHGEISRLCSQAMLDIRMHLFCSPPSINFALQIEQDKQKPPKRKQISEKNRAALESLLGKDKIPVDDEEDVLSIPDEPSNKKQRVSDENEIDKISLSSDSDDSVEITEELILVNNVERKSGQSNANTQNNEDINCLTSIEDKLESEIRDDSTGKESENVVETVLSEKDKNEVVQEKNLHEAKTQIPFNNSNDTIDGEERQSLEVTYDYPNTGIEKVSILEKMDDDNIPSTNDTDDIQITCGQTIRSSPEVDKKTESETDEPKVNGIQTTKIEVDIVRLQVNKPKEKDGVTVEDMLADFVDEVNEESIEA